MDQCKPLPGGRLAHDLDEAEQSWQEAAAKRQEAKMSLLGAHKAYLKEAAIQKEAMEYTKKVGPARYCLPRYRIPCIPRNEGSKRAG